MIEIDEAAFEAEVIAASRETAVLVDFWAPWCGPCQVLGPVLERLETAFGGRFRLVKVNSDENPGIAARYGVRGIPNVIAFLGGQAVDRFVGALPEGEVRSFIERVIPAPAELQRRHGLELARQGHLEEAAEALRGALDLDPALDAARLDLADLLLERMPEPVEPARLEQAGQALAALGRAGQGDERAKALQLRLSTLREAAALPPLAQLEASVAAAPGDLEARSRLAQACIARRQLPQALDQLLEIVGRTRGEAREEARQRILAVLALLAGQPQVVADYRRRLSLLLHR